MRAMRRGPITLKSAVEQWDKDEVELWKSPGGWIHALMDDTVPSVRLEPEDEGGGFLIPGL